MKKNVFFALLIICAVAGLDQITKKLVVHSIVEGQRISVIPGFFDLTLSYNKGAAFGMFSTMESDFLRKLVLWSATFCAIAAVLFMYSVEYKNDSFGKGALACIIGGALGNIIDRMLLGEVVDFLLVYIDPYYWPAFNVADSAICVGVAVILLRKGVTQKKSMPGEEVSVHESSDAEVAANETQHTANS